MGDFPRTVLPISATLPRQPSGYSSWGQSGKGQFRSGIQVGGSWRETFGLIDMKTADGRAFWAKIVQLFRDQEVFYIAPYALNSNLGTCALYSGVSNITVKGAGQTGSNIITTGWDINASPAGWTNDADPGWTNDADPGWGASTPQYLLRAGDVLKITGIDLVFINLNDLLSDAYGSGGSTDHTLSLSPPLYSAPADGATITLAGVKYRAAITAMNFPDGGQGSLYGGVSIDFRESPA